MVRSFSDRVFGGVCGGMAARLPFNAWFIRWFFVILSIASMGLFALIYITLWWMLPQESPLNDPPAPFARFLAALILLLVMVGAWLSGTPDVLLPVILLVMSSVLLLRQL